MTPSQAAEPGTPDDGAAPHPVSERRLVTVLFADLVGFTTISEARDPESTRDLLSAYFEASWSFRSCVGLDGREPWVFAR